MTGIAPLDWLLGTWDGLDIAFTVVGAMVVLALWRFWVVDNDGGWFT